MALLPIGGWGPTVGEGHLDPARAVRATELVEPRLVVPIHWGTYSPVRLRRGAPRWLRDPVHAGSRPASAHAGAGDRLRVLEPGGADIRASSGRCAGERRRRRATSLAPAGPCARRPTGRRGARSSWRSWSSPSSPPLSLWVLAWLLDDFTIDSPADALLAGFVVGLVNAVVWPALAVVVVPLSVLTLGLGAIVLDASW